MSKPTTREEFGNYCLRRLGWPVIDINVAPEQIEDRIDDGLSKYFDYHFDGVMEDYYVVTISDEDISNGYIEIPDQIFSISKILPLANNNVPITGSEFSAQYQFFLNDFYNNQGTVTGNVQYIESIKSYFALVQRQLTPLTSFNFNRKTNRVYFNESLSSIRDKSSIVVFEVYKKLDIETFNDIWDDEFLKDYVTALIKKQWGSNLTKFSNMSLPGGITLNGDAIYTEAKEEITRLEEKLINDLQPPLNFEIG